MNNTNSLITSYCSHYLKIHYRDFINFSLLWLYNYPGMWFKGLELKTMMMIEVFEIALGLMVVLVVVMEQQD